MESSQLTLDMPDEQRFPIETVTMGEVYRLILRLEVRINTMQRDLIANTVNRDVYNTAHQALVQRVVDIEQASVRSDQRRAAYGIALLSLGITNIGAVITAVIANLRIH